jgi:capsular polysaccharide transport system permease protein
MQSVAVASLRAIVALMLREMSTRYGRTPGGYVWAIVQPLGMIILLGFSFSLIATAPVLGTSFMLFKATGFMLLQIFTILGGNIGNSLTFSKPLLKYPRVTWMDAILARYLLNTTVVFTSTFLILGGIILFEGLNLRISWGAVLLAMFLSATLGFGVGCLNAYLFMRFPAWQQIWSILTQPLFIISGVLILYEDFPPIGQDYLWYNPLLHLTGLMRVGFYPMYRPDYISVVFVAFCTLVPMMLGLLLLRRYYRQLLEG